MLRYVCLISCYFFSKQMEVLHSHYLSGALAYPAIYLIDPGIDPDKIHSRQVHALAPAVHGPGYVDG